MNIMCGSEFQMTKGVVQVNSKVGGVHLFFPHNWGKKRWVNIFSKDINAKVNATDLAPPIPLSVPITIKLPYITSTMSPNADQRTEQTKY